MPSHERFALSGRQQTELGIRMLLIVTIGLVTGTWTAIFSRPPTWPIRRVFINAFLRSTFTVRIPRPLVKATSATTGESVTQFCKTAVLKHSVVPLDCGAVFPSAALHFINCSPDDAGSTYFYLHGGGYVDSLSRTAHLPFVIRCARAAELKSIVLLEYTLAPELAYPGQLAQTAVALNHLLKTRKASDIVVAGDSAGGNLALALLAHIIRPRKDIEPVSMSRDDTFRAALLISPWVSAEYGAASYRRNAPYDYLTHRAMVTCNLDWRPVVEEVWASPLVADAGFWRQRLPAERVLLTAGALEVFCDDIEALAQKMSSVSDRVEVAVAPHEVHVQCIIDCLVRYGGGTMTRDVLGWMARLRN